MRDFLNKKKIPGILDFLESKIFERNEQSIQNSIVGGGMVVQNMNDSFDSTIIEDEKF